MKEIQLTPGKVAVIDDEDYELVSQYKWHLTYSDKKKENLYAETSFHIKGTLNKKKSIKMHRLILNITNPKIQGEHIDGNGLNNQRSNLREATHSQNMRNKVSNKISSSKYKGVTWNIKNKKWYAYIYPNKKQEFLGCFSDEKSAASAYDIAAKKYFGEFARLNLK